jgi:hypothetical protein
MNHFWLTGLRIEKGDVRCAIGTVFEVASIVGVPLFGSDTKALAEKLQHTEERLALLPSSLRKTCGMKPQVFLNKPSEEVVCGALVDQRGN